MRYKPLGAAVAHTVLAIVVLAALTSDARAQQELLSRRLFEPLPTEVDYGRYYTRVEDCLAAVARERTAAKWGREITAVDPTRAEPPRVVDAARRCGGRFSAGSAVPADLPLLRELSHHGGRDSLALAVLERELGLLPADTTPQARGELLVRAINFALTDARPARFDWAERRLAEIGRLGWEGRLARVGAYYLLLGTAGQANDTGRIDRYLAASFALIDSIPESERQDLRVKAARGTAVYLGRLRTLARGGAIEPADSALAPALGADFWFRRADSTAPRPTPGRGGLVVFVDAECGPRCHPPFAFLRAVRERFGDAVEVTLVAHTHGYLRSHPPLAPVEEAELLRGYFFEDLRLPGALAVETTRFTRLPPPDLRRVDQAPSNVVDYRPSALMAADGKTPKFGLTFTGADHGVSGFLVDRDGRVLLKLESVGTGHDPLLLAAIAGWLARSAPKS